MSANQPTGKAIKPRASGHDRLSHVGNIGTITLLSKEDEIEELEKETLGHHSRQVKERKVKEIVKSTGVRERERERELEVQMVGEGYGIP